MLKNVKDSNHQPFVNKDGTLAVNKNIKSSKAGNEHDNNEGDYFQNGGQYKGGYSPESNAIHLFAAADQFTIMLCVYPLSYSSAASSGDGYTIQPVGQPMTITMQLTQWNKLKQDLIAQENDLTQLKQKLKQLKKHIQRADAVTEKLTERTKRNQAELDECEQYHSDRMQERAGKIESIIRDVESANSKQWNINR